MKSQVAIYDTHTKALEAISLLSEKKFPMEHVSVVGKADIINDKFKVKSVSIYIQAPMLLFISIGVLLGSLAGIGKISGPLFDPLHDVGLWAGAFIGLTIGLAEGALTMLLVALIVKKDKYLKSKKRMMEDKYLIMVNGPMEEIEKAEEILHTTGVHNHKYVCKDCREAANNSNLSLSML